MLKKISRFLCALSVLLLITAAACAGSAAPDVHSYDCDGVPMTIHADFSAFPVVPVAERKCAYASKDDLIQIRNRIPWQALGIHDLPRDEWEYDCGMLFSFFPKNSIFDYHIISSGLSIHRQENFDSYSNRFGWYIPSPTSRGQYLIENQSDTQYDTQTMKLQDVLKRADDFAKALSLNIDEPAQILYCVPSKGRPFYWLRFPVYLDGLALHYLPLLTGFPDEASDARLIFDIAWGEDGLIALEAPILSSLKASGGLMPNISAEDAAAALRQSFSEQWMPDVKSIVVEKMELSYFSYSSTGFASNGFTTYPAWNFVGYFNDDPEYGAFQVFINALTGKLIF